MFVVVVVATTVDLAFVAATVDSAVNAVYFLISLHMRITNLQFAVVAVITAAATAAVTALVIVVCCVEFVERFCC